MHWMTFWLAVLATRQIVSTWLDGEIFATWRARVQVWRDEGPAGFFRELLQCYYCLAHWVGLFVTASLIVAEKLPEPFSSCIQIPLWSLAVTQGAILLRDWLAGND